MKKFRVYITLYRVCMYEIGRYGSTNQHLCVLPVYFAEVYALFGSISPYEVITNNVINEFNLLNSLE